MARANPNTSPWRSLTDRQKTELLYKYERGMEVFVDGMRQTTLKRRLRGWKDQHGSTIDDDEILDEKNPVRVTATDDNHATIIAKTDQIHTLDDLLDYCNVDREVWAVDKYVTNTWTGYRKNIKKDLTFTSGTIDGEVHDEGDFTLVTLPQIKAWLVRRNPVPLQPIITPVEFNLDPADLVYEKYDHAIKRALVIPDPHFGFLRRDDGSLDPFHDRIALSTALSIAEDLRLDKVIFLGDTLDLSDFSDKFLRSPEFERTTQPAIIEAAWWFAQFRLAAPEAEMYVIEGNHDRRMRDSIVKHLRASYGLKPAQELELPESMSVPRLLGLHTLGIQWVGDYPNGKVWLNDYLCAVHGDAVGQPGATGGKLMKNADYGMVYGHIHRIETSSKTLFGRDGQRNLFAVSPGCMCRVDGVVPARSKENVWQQGLGYIYYNDQDSSIVTVPIIEGTAIFEGRAYQGDGLAVEEILAEDYPQYGF